MRTVHDRIGYIQELCAFILFIVVIEILEDFEVEHFDSFSPKQCL